ncbi:GNAT family N-acetyltransferase [Streptomyces sp. NPDC053048]|uniref:GNAT family N-acetyltransferase n=1 Tax=Streptomyces sp. NPDC053048 TaxID=3365694 RepID=UPI0037D3DF2B
MQSPNTPKPIESVADAPEITRILARAFGDDPMMLWLFPDVEGREDRLAQWFDVMLTHKYGPLGHCERTDAAAAFWTPPGTAEQHPDEGTLARINGLLGEHAPRLGEMLELVGEATPREPHWYLAVLGADPAAQGNGHGAALLLSGLAKADAAGLPAHLESSKEANIGFYERFGFTVRGEIHVPGGGPTLWSMWREARGDVRR